MDKPKNIEEYKKWISSVFEIDVTEKYKNHYESVVMKTKKDVENSEFWKKIQEEYLNYGHRYKKETEYPLFISDKYPEILSKDYDSFFQKTFRYNILNNDCWESEPREGWITPNNWFEKIDDIVRTSFVVKYLDGVEFLLQILLDLAKEKSIKHRVEYKAKEEGYYAVHLYFSLRVEVPKIDFDTEIKDIDFEIQITTQLQESIKQLLHKYYDESRMNSEKSLKVWQWDYKSNEFAVNYLGHILHYLEGTITEIRDKKTHS